MDIFIYGFLMHLAQIIAIGPQNIFVLTNSFQKNKIIPPIICITLDIIMISIMMFGIIKLFSSNYYVLSLFQIFGALFLLKYGISSIKKTIKHKNEVLKIDTKTVHINIIKDSVFISILNPGAWIDTVTISTIGMEYIQGERFIFYFGNITASCVWFFGIGIIGYIFSKFLSNPKTWRYINFTTGIIMFFMAVKLLS